MSNADFLNRLKVLFVRDLFLGGIATIFISCNFGGSGISEVSQGTGLRINEKGGFQYNTSYREQSTPPGLVFIEGGTFVMGSIQNDVMYEWNNVPRKLHVQSFYIDETEVTNIMYMEYIDWIKKVFPPSNPDFVNIYEGVLPDTLVWRNALGYTEDLVTNYLRHPSYAEYPVVGVNWRQAVEYTKWRTNRVNENILEREGYLKEDKKYEIGEDKNTFDRDAYLAVPSKTFGGAIDSLQGNRKRDSINVFTKNGDGIILPSYRLPTEVEWEYAAGTFKQERLYNNLKGRGKYPWKGKYTRSIAFRDLGNQLANFKQGKGDYGGIQGWSDDGGDITVKVRSYPPNGFGLYDMAGNVSEWVADVYRPLIDENVSDFNYFRGNVYTEPVISQDGTVALIDLKTIQYDTLRNGKIIATALPGEVVKKDLDVKDVTVRDNISRSNNIDFNDGDLQSSRAYRQNFQSDEGDTRTEDEIMNSRVYNAPVNNVSTDENGNIVLIPDESSTRTTLIDNEVRVYKGGSWKDRAYWLEPGQRRFLAEYLSTDDIGFRCAMSRVGSKSRTEKRGKDSKSVVKK